MLKYRSNSITGLRLEQLWLIIGLWGQNNTFLTRGMRLMLDMSSQQVEPGGGKHSLIQLVINGYKNAVAADKQSL